MCTLHCGVKACLWRTLSVSQRIPWLREPRSWITKISRRTKEWSFHLNNCISFLASVCELCEFNFATGQDLLEFVQHQSCVSWYIELQKPRASSMCHVQDLYCFIQSVFPLYRP